MFARLKQWYLQPTFQYEEEKRVARILFIINLALLAAHILTVLSGLYIEDWELVTIALAGIFLQLLPVFMLIRGNLRLSSLITSLILLIETTIIATVGAGIHDLALTVYPVIIIIASLLDRRRFILVLLLTVASVGWLVAGQVFGLFVPINYTFTDWIDFALVTAILAVAALAINTLARNMREGLSQARIEIAERQQVENALRESEEKYRRDFNNVSDVIYSLDLELKIINVSPSVERILGYATSEVVGKTFPELNILAPEYLELALSDTLNVFSGKTVKSVYEFLAKDGTRIFGEIFGSPLLSKDGQIIGVVSVARDISKRKRAEDLLRESEEKFHGVFEHSLDAMFIIDETGSLIEVNHAAEKMIGSTAKNTLGKPIWDLLYSLTPEDRKAKMPTHVLRASIEAALQTGRAPWLGQLADTTLQQPDGEIRYIQQIVFPIPYANKFRIAGINRDVTEQRQAEELQNRRTREFEALYETTLDVITKHDLPTLLHAILERAVALIDTHMGGLYLVRPDDGMLELVTTQNVPQNYLGSLLAPGQGLSGRVAQTGQPVIIADYLQWQDRVRAYDNTPFHRTLGIPLKVSDRTIGVITLMDDQRTGSYTDEEIRLVSLFANQAAIAIENARLYANVERELEVRKQAEDELKRAHDDLQAHVIEVEKLQMELREQALHDPLTGLYNRRYLAEMLERELARVKREKKPMSVIVSDIDHFKKINDKYGHQVGDEFLKMIASLFESHTRSSDFACRFGGEEFLLVMPGTSVKSAARRAEELRLQCAQLRIPYENKNLNVTLSFGVASYPSHGQGAEEIVIKADKALYKSKRSGRNCVTVWEGPKGRRPLSE